MVTLRAPIGAFLICTALLAGCGGNAPAGGAAAGSGSPGASAVRGSGRLLIEPQAGAGPYVQLIQGAKRLVEVNSYLLTDRQVVAAMTAAAKRGVQVRAIMAGNPYKDAKAVGQEQAEFPGTGVTVKTAPARFEGQYVFDHAKYVVADPGHPDQAAILGSSNLDYSGLGGGNREYDWQTTSPVVVSALADVFNADWNGTQAGSKPRQALVLSPGSEQAILGLIQSAKQRLLIESEEMGDVPSGIEGRVRAGVQVEVVLPGSLSSADRSNAQALAAAGAKVVLLSHPYPHAKLIVADNRVFLGSENFSASSLDHNREVGIILGGVALDQVIAVFTEDFVAGQPLAGSATHGYSGNHQGASGHSLYGKTEAEVQQLLGIPGRTYKTTYHGQPETAWRYSTQTVYFGADGLTVYVARY